jgi:RNA polymerase sigma-70 factor (ECF subfamily)
MAAAPDEAFLSLVAPHESALRLHCYRMLGSTHDSEDVIQETRIRAWRARDTLESTERVRPWLYRIATNACLDELKSRKQRALPPSEEITWLEPCPDAWLSGSPADPGAIYELKESVALAFVAALQTLSVQQRAVLLLRDVLGLPAEETAAALTMSVSAVNSSLHRARVALKDRVGGSDDRPSVDASSEYDEALLARYVRAWQSFDESSLIELLNHDLIASMPPSPTWLRGRDAVLSFLTKRPFAALSGKGLELVPVRANGQPAFAFYVGGALSALHVLRLRNGRVSEMHHFCDAASFRAFELPSSLEAAPSALEPARAVADRQAGRILASVEVAAPAERVFSALASRDVTSWWERPGVFDTREWRADVRVGGRFEAEGQGRKGGYLIAGEFLCVEPPNQLVHTWQRFEAADGPSTVTYLLEKTPRGTRLTLRHEGITSPEVCTNTALGWETSLRRLAEYLGS